MLIADRMVDASLQETSPTRTAAVDLVSPDVTEWATFNDFSRLADLSSEEERLSEHEKREDWEKFVQKLANETIFEAEKF